MHPRPQQTGFHVSLLRIFLTGLLAWATLAPAQGKEKSAAVALSEMQTLAGAEELCAATIGYYVSLEALNDLALTSSQQTPYDAIGETGTTEVVLPTRGLFRDPPVDLLAAYNAWDGPYVNFQQGRTQTSAGPYDLGSPLDPWGTPYFFYSPAGLLRGDSGSVTLEYYGDDFDRYTLVSHGPDGEQGGGDDLFYPFGGGVSGPLLTGLSGGKAYLAADPAIIIVEAGSMLNLRGYAFGETGSPQNVLLGATPLAPASWSDQAVTVALPQGETGQRSLSLETPNGQTNALKLLLLAPPNAASAWTLYQ